MFRLLIGETLEGRCSTWLAQATRLTSQQAKGAHGQGDRGDRRQDPRDRPEPQQPVNPAHSVYLLSVRSAKVPSRGRSLWQPVPKLPPDLWVSSTPNLWSHGHGCAVEWGQTCESTEASIPAALDLVVPMEGVLAHRRALNGVGVDVGVGGDMWSASGLMMSLCLSFPSHRTARLLPA